MPLSETQHPCGADDESHRTAYNAAFTELELTWRWDLSTWQDLLDIPEEKSRICSYLQRHQAHLLRAYNVGFLADLIYETKQRWYEELSRPGSGPSTGRSAAAG